MSKTAKLMGLLAISTLAFAAVASADCFTQSNGLEFTGPTPQDAVYGCQTTPGTDAYQCQENVSCQGVYPVYPAPYPAPYPYPHPVYPGPHPFPGPGPFPGPHPGPVGPFPGPHPGGPGFGPHPGPGFGPHPHDDV